MIIQAEAGASGDDGRRRRAGYMVSDLPPDVIRFAPPLILTRQADGFVAALPASLDAATKEA